MEDERLFQIEEDGTLRVHEEPYYSVDFNSFNKLLELNKKMKEQIEYTGRKVINKNSGKVGVILRITESDSIQVLEKIEPYVICTHDNWNTLELVD